jgi:hypothetical protein
MSLAAVAQLIGSFVFSCVAHPPTRTERPIAPMLVKNIVLIMFVLLLTGWGILVCRDLLLDFRHDCLTIKALELGAGLNQRTVCGRIGTR